MALTLLAANNAQTVLAAGLSASATTLTVNTGTGNLFPSPVSGASFFKLTLVDAATGQLTEILHVTARSGDAMTVERAQEGTTARAWSVNDIAANMMTAGTLNYVLTNFQPLDATLTTLAALATAANKLPYFTGADVAALTDFTDIGRNVIGQSSVANLRTYLGLGAAAQLGVATNSDMQTGTSTTLLTTVANVLSLFSKKVFGISDYIRIPDRPGGLIIQWTQTGSIGSVNADTTITPRAVTFPIPFPNAALNYIAFPSAPNSTQAGVVPIASELTLTGCNVGLYNSTTTAKTVTNIIVFVVGY